MRQTPAIAIWPTLSKRLRSVLGNFRYPYRAYIGRCSGKNEPTSIAGSERDARARPNSISAREIPDPREPGLTTERLSSLTTNSSRLIAWIA